MNLLSVRDVYNLVCGSWVGITLIDIRSSHNYVQSHIGFSQNFDIKANNHIESTSIQLFDQITQQLRTSFFRPFNSYIFVADESTMEHFDCICHAFENSKFKKFFFMESVFDVFKNQYEYVCSENSVPYKYPCEILPNLFLGFLSSFIN
jgi:hypothetical protein